MRKQPSIAILCVLILSLVASIAEAQPNFRRLPRPGSGGAGGKGDSVGHRTGFEDSITIAYRYLDTSRMQKFDSTIFDFTKRFPLPWDHYNLGNLGTATHSMLFPQIKGPGFDQGFHALDAYNFNDNETRFYNTTRPYSELVYQIGSRFEQIIGLSHTRNIKPNWNAAFTYRLINSPGLFQNQNNNHNNYRLSSWYQSYNKRYQNFVVIVGNKLSTAENGGIKNDRNYLDSSGIDRDAIPVQLGPNLLGSSRNFFSNAMSVGSNYTNATYLMRQQYDIIGNKDSIVTDSSVIPLFYARLRAEHTITYKTRNYRFFDNTAKADSAYFVDNYQTDFNGLSSVYIQDRWRDLTNDFSLYQFPEAKNSQQFVKVGAAFQLLNFTYDTGVHKYNYHNFMIHGEYRNKTRNQKWDIEANGMLYLNGLNSGDYDAHISLRRLISKQLGSLTVGFANVNRTPSFVYDTLSRFYMGDYRDFKKENNTEIFGVIDVPKLRARLTGRYTLVSNYTYFTLFKQPEQYNTLFNVLQLTLEKQFMLGKHWNWKTWMVVQKPTGTPPLNLPTFFTRNMLGYDGNLGFKNLLITFGLEFRYYSSFYADAYSPVIGQFFYQTEKKTKLDFPELAGYLHFRIKSFTAYIRAENLNAYKSGGFNNNNVISPNYPYPGLWIRVGVYWSFVN